MCWVTVWMSRQQRPRGVEGGHAGGEVAVRGRARFRNACDYCHLIPFPAEGATGAPATWRETLNPYGLAYAAAGRDAGAIHSLGKVDSDGDGFANEVEIADLRYPGHPGSRPGQPRAKLEVLGMADLERMPRHRQFLLANSHKQRFDSYAHYEGVRIRDLLEAVGVDLDAITGITLISVDGFKKDFDVDRILKPYPAGRFYAGLDTGTLGIDRGFVTYPPALPGGLIDGGEIPGEQWLTLAFARDGGPMDPVRPDPASGKIDGEGPLRIVVPQSAPGAPDRGSSCSPSGFDDGYDYDDTLDHNAGDMARGVVAIRVNPMPEGFEEFDAMNGGWAYAGARQLVIYGRGIE